MRVGLGVLLGALMFVIALPLGPLPGLASICFVPLFLAIRRTSFLTGFVSGLLVSFGAALVARSGIFYAVKADDLADGWLFTGFGLYGLTISILAGVYADSSNANKPAWFFAALATLLEACLLIELPAHLALTQYKNPLALWVASIGGIWLVSFLLWHLNVGLARLSGVKLAVASILSVALLQITHYSADALTFLNKPDRQNAMKVAAIQTELVDREPLTQLSSGLNIGEDRADVIVWPEFGGLFLTPQGNTDTIREIAREAGAQIVTSFTDAHQPLPHNVASVLDKDGESERYIKRKLFGGEKSMHTAGSKAVAASGIGLNICFDSCFPNVIRQTASLPEVKVIALPTIDPPSRHHFIAALHMAFSPFRSAETGIPIVRADGYAYSSITDFDGRILQLAQPGEQVLLAETSGTSKPLARTVGDGFLIVCGALTIAGWWQDRKRKAKETQGQTLQES